MEPKLQHWKRLRRKGDVLWWIKWLVVGVWSVLNCLLEAASYNSCRTIARTWWSHTELQWNHMSRLLYRWSMVKEKLTHLSEPNFHISLQPCGTNLPLGWKPQSFLGWIQIPSKCCPVRFGNRTFPTASEGASNQMQPRSTCVLVQLLLRCSGPVPLPTVRQPRPNDTPYIPTHDTKAWSIKWKLSPNKVQCIDKSSCFWMLSYSPK